MAMTRSELAAHVRLNIGNRTDLNSQINDFLDWTLEDIAELRNWKEMKRVDNTTVRTREGGIRYPLPDMLKDIIECRYVDGTNSHTLKYVPMDEFQRRWPDPERGGNSQPQWYTTDNDCMLLYPIPNESGKVIELYAAFWPEPFESDDSECPFFQMEKVIVAGATAYCYGVMKEPDQEAIWSSKFMGMLIKKFRKDSHPSDWTFQYAGNKAKNRVYPFVHIVSPLSEGEALN